ncbi:50S ribosomal protein L18 [Patescibacteria group bacterium]|nr:50S ribosomal protein L18 [Patescibacteria group bacterium]
MADINAQKKRLSRISRHRRVRAKVSGTVERPRLSVFRSSKYISGQIIDDQTNKTIAAATEHELDAKTHEKLIKGDKDRRGKCSIAFAVGKILGEKARVAGITKIVFDRGGYSYTGRVAALADGVRESGLEF